MALLITGGCGFIGSNFINNYFESLGAIGGYTRLVNLDAMYYCAREENIQPDIRRSSNYVFVKGNICDKAKATRSKTATGIAVSIQRFASSSPSMWSGQYVKRQRLSLSSKVSCSTAFGGMPLEVCEAV